MEADIGLAYWVMFTRLMMWKYPVLKVELNKIMYVKHMLSMWSRQEMETSVYLFFVWLNKRIKKKEKKRIKRGIV